MKGSKSKVKGQKAKVKVKVKLRNTFATFALCLLTFDLLGCAKAPAALPSAPPPLDPLAQLTQDITAITNGPGVRRAAWVIVIESLDRRDRLFELNPRTLLVPASTL